MDKSEKGEASEAGVKAERKGGDDVLAREMKIWRGGRRGERFLIREKKLRTNGAKKKEERNL